jgi:signal transduction histidine kinase
VKQRIRGAIVGVSVIVLVALGVPLAIAVHRSAVDAELLELHAAAATALAELDVPLDRAELSTFASEPDAPPEFGVYGRDGRRLFGVGPRRADATVQRALRGAAASSSSDGLVVATPIIEPQSEAVRGALRLVESANGAENRARAGYLLIAGAGIAALGLAWLIASRLARTLAKPLSDLASRAEAIGDGAAFDSGPTSGIDEIDALAAVLHRRARDVSAAILRERQFSADVSHQLRTPITALRLKLEELERGESESSPALRGAFHDLDRIQASIEHLLAIARDSIPSAGPIRLDEVVSQAVARWQIQARGIERTVLAQPSEPTTVIAHRTSVDEVLDVLIDNALRHGTGAIAVALRHIANGVALDVADEGRLADTLHAERLFDRGHGSGTGIGLSVARAVAEAEGGRLVLSRHSPTTFSLLLIAQ